MDRRIISLCSLIFFICSVFTNVSSAVIETSKTSSPASKLKTAELQPDVLIFPTDTEYGTASEKIGDSESSTSPPTPCPDGALFCESADDYPEDLIKKNLKKQPKVLLDIFYEEEIGEDVHNKLGPDFGIEKELCSSSPQIIYPKKGQSKEGVFEFIVNDGEHRQGVKVETCRNTGGECSELPANILPFGYKSTCVQRTIQRMMVVFNSTTNVQGFVTKPFDVPSCCSCVITMSVPGYDRIGDMNTTPANTTRRTPTAADTKKIKSSN